MNAVGFAENSSKGLLRGHGAGNGAFESEAFVEQRLGLLAGPGIQSGEGGGRPFPLVRRGISALKGFPVTGIGHRDPVTGVRFHFDAIGRGQAIGEFSLTVAGPSHPVDAPGFAELQDDPSAALFVRHPAVGVAVLSIVDEAQFVSVLHGGVAGGSDSGAPARQGDVSRLQVPDFQLVDAGFQRISLQNGEAHPPCADRSKTVGVHPGLDGRARQRCLGGRVSGGRTGSGQGFQFRQSGHHGCLALFPPADVFPAGLGFRVRQFPISVFDPGEEGLHAEIIPGRNRVELVIMAPRAADAQTQEALGGVDDDFVEGVLSGQALGNVVGSDLARQKHRGRDQESRGGVATVLISSQLLPDEVGIGRVGIEGLDHVVPIRPGMGAFGVDLETMGVGVAHHIQPMLAPVLSVGRRLQEGLHHPLSGIRARISLEGQSFLRCRRKAGQVEVHPAQPGDAVGFG